ncbi:MAG: hypothetical protein ACR2LE_01490 [Nocardioidaceae bacterium]
MTTVRRSSPAGSWPTVDVEIPIRALLLETTSSEFYRNESELRAEISGRLAQSLLDPASYIAEYQDPLTGAWMSWGGWDAPSYGTPDLSEKEVEALIRTPPSTTAPTTARPRSGSALAVRRRCPRGIVAGLVAQSEGHRACAQSTSPR